MTNGVIEIVSRYTDKVVFSLAANTIKEVVIAAIKSGANLSGAYLSGADLRGANLREAYLSRADLSRADLRGANLREANLSEADLRGADLYGANLREAYLYGADLYGANLSEANLSGAKNIPSLCLAKTNILPESGPFFGWKKCKDNVLVKLAIGAKAKRSNSTGRKCRAEYVKVLEVIGAEYGISQHDGITKYVVGSVVRCDKWNEDRWQECGGGIHFFITRVEAENY